MCTHLCLSDGLRDDNRSTCADSHGQWRTHDDINSLDIYIYIHIHTYSHMSIMVCRCKSV